MSTMELLVARKRMEARDVASFELRRPDGGPLPAFAAGAHIDITAPNGMVRQYSLCNAPSERHRYQIAVLHDANRAAARARLSSSWTKACACRSARRATTSP